MVKMTDHSSGRSRIPKWGTFIVFPRFAHFASIQLCRLHARLSQSSFTPTINLGLLLRRNKDANNNATKNAPLFTDTIRYHNRGGKKTHTQTSFSSGLSHIYTNTKQTQLIGRHIGSGMQMRPRNTKQIKKSSSIRVPLWPEWS